jgi:hypothetical protein
MSQIKLACSDVLRPWLSSLSNRMTIQARQKLRQTGRKVTKKYVNRKGEQRCCGGFATICGPLCGPLRGQHVCVCVKRHVVCLQRGCNLYFATGSDLRSTQTYPRGFAKRVATLAAAHSVADIIKSDPARQIACSKYPAFERFEQFDEQWSDAGLQGLWALIDRRLAKHAAA